MTIQKEQDGEVREGASLDGVSPREGVRKKKKKKKK